MPATAYQFVIDLVRRRTSDESRVLEVGCGEMHYESRIPGQYVGLDLPVWQGVDRVPDVVGSADAMPIADCSFDVVFGVAVFYYIPDVDRAFRECYRVLRPGGHLLVFDYTRNTVDRLVAAGDESAVHRWSAGELRGRLVGSGFPRWGVRNLSHRATEGGDPTPLRRAVRRIKAKLDENWTQWLILDARR